MKRGLELCADKAERSLSDYVRRVLAREIYREIAKEVS